MTHGFLQSTLLVRSSNGRDDTLEENLRYRSKDGHVYRAPVGSTTDGMSTPKIVQMIPGFEPFGNHWFSAAFHDSGYRGTLEIKVGDHWEPANLTRQQIDALMREALITQGVHPARAEIIYRNLRLFGGPNFKARRKV